MTSRIGGERRLTHEHVVIAYAATYLGLLAVAPLVGGWVTGVTNVLYFGIGAATAWSQWQVTRRLAGDVSRRAWTLLLLSSLTHLVSGSLWTLWLAVRSTEMPAMLTMVVDFAYAPLAFAAFLAFPSREGFSLRNPKVRLDSALFVLGAVALSWHFALRPLLDDNAALSIATLVPIVGDWGLALVASIAFLRVASGRDRAAIAFLLAGHLLYILTDFFWGISRGQYVPGHWVDGFWFSAWLLRWMGTRRALHSLDAKVPLDAGVTTDAGLGPSLFVAGAYLLLVLALLVEPSSGAIDIALAAAAMTALLVARQRAALAENQALAVATASLAARFKALAASATDFVLVVDAVDCVRYASPSLERFTGATRLASQSFAALVHPDDRVGVAAWLEAQSAGQSRRVHRCRLRVGDGAYREVEFRVQDRRLDPLILGYVLNGRDISAEVQLEAQLGHARKLATLSDMAGRIAHAFNNTLAVLQGHAELLVSELAADAPAREDVRAIRAAAERGAGITRQLLGFSGRHVIRPEPFDPGEVAEELLPSLRRLLPSRVTLSLAREFRGSVLLDRAQFEQVLLNLVANARDGMPQAGTIRLTVRERVRGAPGEAAQRGSRRGETVRRELEMIVADEGVGIPDELLTRVFEPFFTTKPSGQGTGLGLAMVASIVKRAGGEVEVQSVVGKGTTFTVVLPCVDAGPAPEPPLPTESQAPALSAGVVLLVDDDPLVRRATARMVKRSGFTVVEAETGREALEIAGQPDQPIDILLTDLMMPGLSGREVIASFRVSRPGVPVVCVTGFAAEREDAGALALEVQAIVAKPFTSETLSKALSSAVAMRTVGQLG